MGNKRNGILAKRWRRHFAVFFVALIIAGCKSDSRIEYFHGNEKPEEGMVIETTVCYYSDIQPKDCFLCGERNGSLMSLYRGQKNLGIISLNTFDLIPISINLYDDFGKLLEKPVDSSSTHTINTGEDGFVFSVTANVNRGYAHGYLSFRQNEILNIEKAATGLCSGCLTHIMGNCWGDQPFCIGVIDFNTGEVRLFEEHIRAFTFGDYYISCDGQNDDGKKHINLLFFYCPERYLE